MQNVTHTSALFMGGNRFIITKNRTIDASFKPAVNKDAWDHEQHEIFIAGMPINRLTPVTEL